MLWAKTWWLRNLTSSWRKWWFSFWLSPVPFNLLRTVSRPTRWSWNVCENARKYSKKINTIWNIKSPMVVCISHRYVAGALHWLKGILSYSYRPNGVVNTILFLSFACTETLRYPLTMLMVEKNSVTLRPSRLSSMWAEMGTEKYHICW